MVLLENVYFFANTTSTTTTLPLYIGGYCDWCVDLPICSWFKWVKWVAFYCFVDIVKMCGVVPINLLLSREVASLWLGAVCEG